MRKEALRVEVDHLSDKFNEEVEISLVTGVNSILTKVTSDYSTLNFK